MDHQSENAPIDSATTNYLSISLVSAKATKKKTLLYIVEVGNNERV
jgi:hypothetical protein